MNVAKYTEFWRRNMNKRDKKRKEHRYLERQADKLKLQGAEQAIDMLYVIPLYVLREQFGFGNVILMRFIERFNQITEQLGHKKVPLRTLVDHIEYETGIKLQDNAVINTWNIDGEPKRVVRRPRKNEKAEVLKRTLYPLC